MSELLPIIFTALGGIIAGSGFWAFVSRIIDKKSANSKMLLGLGHDKILYLCNHYIERGYITTDEYENLHDYLFIPYQALGGNGTAERLMKEVSNLPIKKATHAKEE